VSAFTDDPRVTPAPRGGGYAVALDDGRRYRVLETGPFGWTICDPRDLSFVQMSGGGVTNANLAIGFRSADDALAVLLDPASPASVADERPAGAP
jgi:hypothetical protein